MIDKNKLKIGDILIYNGYLPYDHIWAIDTQNLKEVIINNLEYNKKYIIKELSYDNNYIIDNCWCRIENILDDIWYPLKCFDIYIDDSYMKNKYNLK